MPLPFMTSAGIIVDLEAFDEIHLPTHRQYVIFRLQGDRECQVYDRRLPVISRLWEQRDAAPNQPLDLAGVEAAVNQPGRILVQSSEPGLPPGIIIDISNSIDLLDGFLVIRRAARVEVIEDAAAHVMVVRQPESGQTRLVAIGSPSQTAMLAVTPDPARPSLRSAGLRELGYREEFF